MNCDDFQTRFHRHLDDRRGPLDDAMQRHVESCDHCDRVVRLWGTIQWATLHQTHKVRQAASGGDPVGFPSRGRGILQTRFVVTAIAAAACVLLILRGLPVPPSQYLATAPAVVPGTTPAIMPGVTPAVTATAAAADSHDAAAMNMSLAWDELRQRDWLGPAMPTVLRVRDGVAPLGRSIKRAATLLATASKRDEAEEAAT